MNNPVKVAVAVAAALAGCGLTGGGLHGAPPSDLAGVWEVVTIHSGRDTPYSVLTIELRVRGDEVSGRYCFILDYGNRIDCDPASGENFQGRLSGNGRSAHVSFQSFFGGGPGQATLNLRDSVLLWTVTVTPDGGLYPGPMQAKLLPVSRAGD